MRSPVTTDLRPAYAPAPKRSIQSAFISSRRRRSVDSQLRRRGHTDAESFQKFTGRLGRFTVQVLVTDFDGLDSNSCEPIAPGLVVTVDGCAQFGNLVTVERRLGVCAAVRTVDGCVPEVGLFGVSHETACEITSSCDKYTNRRSPNINSRTSRSLIKVSLALLNVSRSRVIDLGQRAPHHPRGEYPVRRRTVIPPSVDELRGTR